MHQEAVQSEAAAGGHSTSGPVSAQDRAAVQDAAMPALSQRGEEQHGRVYAFYALDSGAGKERSSRAGGAASSVCPQDVRRSCMIATVAIVICVPVAVVICCIAYRIQKKFIF